ncbi:MAG TPA: DUF2189 domain-containing protein [Methylomirabilota bacterium]|nr:DUF2189 domain-containing protein [Methylomirabilota bacterium]
MPTVRSLTAADIRAALGVGIDDFRAAPAYGFVFGGIYAIGGLMLIAAVTRLSMPWLAYPLAAGFALIGPFVAVGLYEVSRRLAAREPLSFGSIFGVIFAQRGRELAWMAFVTLFVFLIWMYQVRVLLALFLGLRSFASFSGFLEAVFTTPEGLLFLAIGHVVGAALSLLVFSITVVSIPLLLDRDVDFITAMITSVKAVATSPVPMLGWGIVVAVSLLVASLPMFVGLVVVLPVLGHTTWHLYKRVVEPAAPAPESRPDPAPDPAAAI